MTFLPRFAIIGWLLAAFNPDVGAEARQTEWWLTPFKLWQFYALFACIHGIAFILLRKFAVGSVKFRASVEGMVVGALGMYTGGAQRDLRLQQKGEALLGYSILQGLEIYVQRCCMFLIVTFIFGIVGSWAVVVFTHVLQLRVEIWVTVAVFGGILVYVNGLYYRLLFLKCILMNA